MNVRRNRPREDATTLLEVIVLVAVMAVVAAMLLPPVSRSKVYSRRVACVNNLKNVGLADRIFSTDHNGNYPWMLGGTNGTKDFLDDPTQLWRHFAIVSNELSTPKILVCPSDPERTVAPNFASFGPSNLSYFLGLQSSEEEPQSILAGDRNLMTNGVSVGPGTLRLSTNLNFGFTKKIHNGTGNMVLGDGSVQQVTGGRFQQAVVDAALASTNGVNRLLIP